MTSFKASSFDSIEDKVVVLTGGAAGIGAGTVKHFYQHGAKVVFGDINETAGKAYAAEFDSSRVSFLQTDVTRYDDNLRLFKHALALHGRIDHAITIAGIIEVGNMFKKGLSIQDVEKPHSVACLRIDLEAVLFFARIATAYLAHDSKPEDNKSISFMSSSAALVGMGGVPVYCAAKHGILGLMRSLEQTHPSMFNIRVNAVTPHAVKTSMIDGYEAAWHEHGVPICSVDDIANIFRSLSVGRNQSGASYNGRTIFATGNQAFDIEETAERSRDSWLGPVPTETLRRSAEAHYGFFFD